MEFAPKTFLFLLFWIFIAKQVYSATDPCNKPFFCISGDAPEVVADPDDCKKYFQCLNNQWAHFTCTGDSTFDSEVMACVGNNKNCHPGCPMYTGPSTESATVMPSGTCPGTPENCTEKERYPDAGSCHSYFECEDGQLQLKFCDGFTPVFDIHNLECFSRHSDFDCQYRCKTPAPSTPLPTTKGTTKQEESSFKSSTVTAQSESSKTSTATTAETKWTTNSSPTTAYPSEQSTSSQYIANQTEATTQTTETDTVSSTTTNGGLSMEFAPKTFLLLFIWIIVVKQVNSDLTDPCDKPWFCITGEDPEIVADPDDCKKYFQCLNNQWAHFTCPGDSTFDSEAMACAINHYNCFPPCPVYTGPSTVSTTRMPSDTCPGTPDNCTEGEKYPDANGCFSYYECLEGVLQLKFCSGFTPVFDIHKLNCTVLPEDFNCEYRCKTAAPNTQFPTTKETTEENDHTEKSTYISEAVTDLTGITVNQTESMTEMTETVTDSTEFTVNQTEAMTEVTETVTDSTEFTVNQTESMTKMTETVTDSTELTVNQTESMTEVTETVTDSTEFTVNHTEAMTEVTETVTDSTEFTVNHTEAMTEVTETVTDSTEFTVNQTEAMTEMTETVTDSTEFTVNHTEAMTEVTETVTDSTEFTVNHTEAMTEVTETVTDSTEFTVNQTEAMTEMTETVTDSTEFTVNHTESMTEVTETVTDSTEFTVNQTEAMTEMTETVTDLTGITVNQTESMTEMTETVTDSTELTVNQTEAMTEVTETVTDSTEFTVNQTEAMTEMTETVTDSTQTTEEFLNGTMTSTIESTIITESTAVQTETSSTTPSSTPTLSTTEAPLACTRGKYCDDEGALLPDPGGNISTSLLAVKSMHQI
ncbi:hypothetical protein CAPTEDRAFT_203299 [Capitella teleta]|uniref:Chitin-binding type-2 domain-containing protein n=1 Tax=Capitella teleta TaxID=283909 RepID=R7TTJ0_CAPTE|nr:hypothetical protein CAPTEDRAFT_203299 [Capitella teleta]|eukprot:ELT96927.1 hypothetical protein CAPTEDRAFT_203299 [Capitella teleta]